MASLGCHVAGLILRTITVKSSRVRLRCACCTTAAVMACEDPPSACTCITDHMCVLSFG